MTGNSAVFNDFVIYQFLLFSLLIITEPINWLGFIKN